ncbi:group II intron maturase-specific domain-containing protein [Bradyrhizobium ottawaense]|uniref:group II intron maturase-specific domain-containing protein n=1 Tax=Bradyrhizobium TaxID=374 RepID=UPI001AECF56B
MRHTVRRWRLHRRSDLELVEIAKWVRPVLTGWVRYYGRFYPSKLQEELRTIDAYIVRGQHENTNGSEDTRWRYGNGYDRSSDGILACSPTGLRDQRLDDGSRMNREVHVRF